MNTGASIAVEVVILGLKLEHLLHICRRTHTPLRERSDRTVGDRSLWISELVCATPICICDMKCVHIRLVNLCLRTLAAQCESSYHLSLHGHTHTHTHTHS